MPDTGAPWNIPYADPSDLVRDWPGLSEDIAEAVADGLDVGLGRNIVQVRKDTRFQTSSATYVEVTGFTVTITPSQTTSKVLLVYTLPVGLSAGANSGAQLLRGASPLDEWLGTTMGGSDNRGSWLTASGAYLDSPGVITPVTYTMEIKVSAGTMSACGNNVNALPGYMTAIEVAA